MAMEQYITEPVAQNDNNGQDETFLKKWKSTPAPVDECENTPSSGFDCNICLDFVRDPVVTLCGHLYCWPCIYKWIHFQSVSPDNRGQQKLQCPVCKDEISQKAIVPLYGRGLASKPSVGKAPHLGIVIPSRPPSPRCGGHNLMTNTTNSSPRPAQNLQYPSSPQPPQLSYPYTGSNAGTPTESIHPMTGMYGEMVYATIFGDSETTLNTYPDSYHMSGSGTPRVRRHVMEADKSLSRVCIFLCCCIVTCLLLF